MTVLNYIKRKSHFHFVFALLGLFCCVSILLISNWFQSSPSEQICNSLIREDLIDSNEQCIKSNYPYVYIPWYFPVNQVDVEYVNKGMHGFEILDLSIGERCSDGRELEVLYYGLTKDFFIGTYVETVDFAFCDGLLTTIRHHD